MKEVKWWQENFIRHKTIKYRFNHFSINTNYYVNIIDFQITLLYRLCLGCFTLLVIHSGKMHFNSHSSLTDWYILIQSKILISKMIWKCFTYKWKVATLIFKLWNFMTTFSVVKGILILTLLIKIVNQWPEETFTRHMLNIYNSH